MLQVCKFCGPLEHAAGQHGEGHHVAGQHGKGHHARHCVYGSIVNQKDSVNNNSHPQIPDEVKFRVMSYAKFYCIGHLLEKA
jgi:hypothetical protein